MLWTWTTSQTWVRWEENPEYCAKFHGAVAQFPLFSPFSAGDIFSPNCFVEIFWIDWWSITGSSHHLLPSHSPWRHKGKRDHPHLSHSLCLIPALHASIQIRKKIKNTKKMDMKESKRRRILITLSGVQWGVTEHHSVSQRIFSFLWEVLVHVGHIQNIMPGWRLPNFEIFHKVRIEKLQRVRQKVSVCLYFYIFI